MMQRLDAAGYVERLYEVDPSTGGRSRILFRPVAGQAPARPQGPSPTERLPSEWQALRPWLLQQVQDAQDRGGPQVLHDLHERSEERRVGKEGRSRWSADHEKKVT